VPSDAVLPKHTGSRLDTVDAVVMLPGIRGHAGLLCSTGSSRRGQLSSRISDDGSLRRDSNDSDQVPCDSKLSREEHGRLHLVIARHLGFFVFLCRRKALRVTPPWTLTATIPCRSAAADRCLAATDMAPSRMCAVAPYSKRTCLASGRSVDSCRTRKGGSTTAGLLISKFYHRKLVKALEHTRWRRRLISLLNRVIRRRGSVACSAPVRAGGRICGHSCGDPQDIRLSQPRCV
jgi:hypothetical protein